jgi:hypothetical protein
LGTRFFRKAALSAALCGCWGYPKLAIRGESTAAGVRFSFGYCAAGRPPPPLLAITVSESDATGKAIEPPVCRLSPREGEVPTRVDHWVYGSELPALVIMKCTPLQPNRRYQIGIGGGGDGAVGFTTDDKGVLKTIEAPCR